MLFRSKTPTTDAALRDLDADSDKARLAAASALGNVRDEDRERAAAGLLGVLGDPRVAVRSAACLSLGHVGDESSVAGLAACLDDAVPEVRQLAAISLGKIGSSDGFAPLARALVDGPPDLRFQAATSLVEIDGDAAFEPLMAALDDDDAEVIGAVALALGGVGDPRAGDRLAALLEHPRPETRFDVAYGLAQLGDPRAIPVLGAFLTDAASGWDAASALEDLGGEAVAPLASVLDEPRLRPRTAMRVAGALLHLAPEHAAAPRARTVLLDGLRHRKLELRGVAVGELAKVGGPWSRGALEALARRRAGRVHAEYIAKALERASA